MSNALKYKAWYEANRDRVSARRKSLYQNDPAYKQQVLERSALAREARRQQKPEVPGVSIAEACESLGIQPWTLNKWKNLGYYPDPMYYEGKPRFTLGQVELLGMIREFFLQYPKRSSALHRDKLEQIVQVIAHNWNS